MPRRIVNVRTKVRNVSRSPLRGRTPSKSNPEVKGRPPSRSRPRGRTPQEIQMTRRN